MIARRGVTGQATVEVVGLVPLLVAVAVAAWQVLAAGAAAEAAGAAAHAGAVALVQGADPVTEARAALAGWPRAATRIEVRAGRVVVRVRPRAILPALGRRLAAVASADAGTATRRAAGPRPQRGGDGTSARP